LSIVKEAQLAQFLSLPLTFEFTIWSRRFSPLQDLHKDPGPSGQRKLPRHSYPIEVIIVGIEENPGTCPKRSLGGTFIETSQPLWWRAEFTVRLSLPEPIELDCIVKHVEPARGMGVEFKDVPEAERKQLESLVASLVER
jgi:PilZ domain